MRPRAFTRGRFFDVEQKYLDQAVGFNEAPGVHPGKVQKRMNPVEMRRLGFNEAPGVHPGKVGAPARTPARCGRLQ